MIIVCRVLLLSAFIVFGYSLCAQTSELHHSVSQRDLNVVLTLSSSKVLYSLKETLSLETALHNDTSIEPIFLYSQLGWGRGRGISLEIEDVNGKEIRPPVMIDDVPPPPPSYAASMLVGLRLGQFFGIKLQGPVSDLFRKSGRYRLRTTYRSVLVPDLIDSNLRTLNIVWSGQPPVSSAWITIEITP
jgi:hypothetical protein